MLFGLIVVVVVVGWDCHLFRIFSELSIGLRIEEKPVHDRSALEYSRCYSPMT